MGLAVCPWIPPVIYQHARILSWRSGQFILESWLTMNRISFSIRNCLLVFSIVHNLFLLDQWLFSFVHLYLFFRVSYYILLRSYFFKLLLNLRMRRRNDRLLSSWNGCSLWLHALNLSGHLWTFQITLWANMLRTIYLKRWLC